MMNRFVAMILGSALALGMTPVLAQDRPADTMQILREKIRADKKLLVATNMDLTESEARSFWPVYEAYQRDLEKLNERLATVIKSYAADYRTLGDDKARALVEEAIAIEEGEAQLKKAYVGELSKALPGKKVARYLQIESKIRAVVRYDLAAHVPLAR